MKLPKLELILDIKTHWNSTETILDQALLLKKALHVVASSDNNLKKYILLDNEWDCINEIHKFLQVCNLLINLYIYKSIILINIILYIVF